MALKEWFSVQELVGLPGMPGSEYGVLKRLKKNLTTNHPKVQGKGIEFALKDLPPETQSHIRAQVAAQVLACLPQPAAAELAEQQAARPPAPAMAPAPPDVWGQTNAQRAVATARQTVLRFVARLQSDAGCSPRAAMLAFLTQAAAGRIDDDTSAAVLTLARDARGRKAKNPGVNAQGLPTLRTLQSWCARGAGLADGQNLAPALRQPDMTLAPWMVLAVELKARPQKPATSEVLLEMRAVWPQWSAAWVASQRRGRGPGPAQAQAVQAQDAAMASALAFPSADQLYRFFRDKYSRLDALKGQHQGSALRAHTFYRKRTHAGLMPWDEVHADGWNTHFLAPHPVSGEYVTFEVWHFHDVATGYTSPFSVGLSESAEVIMKGLENCIRTGGVPLIWQTDSTGSVKNAQVEFDPVTSLSARAGLTVVHPVTVGNSQANGIAENYNKYLDKKSKALATYQHPSMDTLAVKQVKKFTAQMVKAAKKGDPAAQQIAKQAVLRVGKGILFETTEHMLAWLEQVRVEGNNTPHSKLARITCPQTGRVRHQTPQEALDAFKRGGWEPVELTQGELVELFYPHISKKVFRQCVTIEGQRYTHADLGAFEGETVVVAVDRMDGTQVWIKDAQGALLCCAHHVPEVGYRCLSTYERAEERRMAAQIKRREAQIEAIKDRRDPARAPIDAPALAQPTAHVFDLSLAGTLRAQAQAQPLPRPAPEPETWAERVFGAQVDATWGASAPEEEPELSYGERLLRLQEAKAAQDQPSAPNQESWEERCLRITQQQQKEAQQAQAAAAARDAQRDAALLALMYPPESEATDPTQTDSTKKSCQSA